ncbi:MAG: pitrilysin family protein [Bacteroidales bacterium]|nr:pitrilysin family protein [Bacteroidales bacterium]
MNLLHHTLPNGIRLVHKTVPNMIAHAGVIINTGSRDEKEEEHGMAHFVEHMLFKGTGRRKTYHILSSLEDRGGELNAYTTKEETAIYGSFLKHDYNKAFDIISDVLFNSIFPEKEILKEKEVIIEEINSYRDTPSELIFDDFEEMIFEGAPIGRNILGSEKSLHNFNRSMIHDFMNNNYNPSGMVVCSIGNIREKQLIKLFEKYFSDIPAKQTIRDRTAFTTYKPKHKTLGKNTWQDHCIIGNIAYNVRDKKRLALFLLNNILGGQGMNSRLNLSLREKKGFAYNVESNYTPYCDSGVFLIYFGTDEKNRQKSIGIAMKELKRLRDQRLGRTQLQKAKNQIKGNIARGREIHENLMLAMGKNILLFDRMESTESLYEKIDLLSPSDLLEIANEVFSENLLSTLIYTK